MESRIALLGGKFRQVHAGENLGAIGVLQKNVALILKGFHFGGDRKAEQSADFRFVESGIEEADVFLDDAAFGVNYKYGGQGGDAAVGKAGVAISQRDGVIDAFGCNHFVDQGFIVVVHHQANNLQAVLVTALQRD